jgi:hypothetical protein
MPWAVVMKNLETGKMEIIPANVRVDANDPRFGLNVHIVPMSPDLENPGCHWFGVHEFAESCCCRPEIQEQVYGGRLVIHRESVN